MKYIRHIFILIAWLCPKLYCQNLIPNNSFENHYNYTFWSHKPDNFSQFSKILYGVSNWNNAGETTPDWFSSRSPAYLGVAAGQNVQPASGTEYVGIAPFEGIEVRLANGIIPTSLEKGKFYKLSFWFCARQTSTQLKVHLRDNRISDNDLKGPPDHEAPWTNTVPFQPHLSFNIDINTDPSTPGSFLPGVWYQYESNPIYIKGNEIKWLAITGDNSGDAGYQSTQMVYLDELGLSELNICELPCLSNLNLPAPEIILYAPNAMHEGQNPFKIVVENALGFELEVQGSGSGLGDGNVLFYHSEFSSLGLENTGFPKIYEFKWYGDAHFYNSNLENVDNEHSIELPRIMEDAVYVYRYTVFGCPQNIESGIKTIHYFPDNETPYLGTTTPSSGVPDYSNCCRKCRYLSNIELNEVKIYKASSGIYLGNSADIFNPGSVLFNSESDVKLLAGEEIVITEDVDMVAGAEIIGEITDCPYQQTSFWQRLGEEEKDSIKKDNDVIFSVYPNPANEFLNISLGKNEIDIHKVLIFDIAGRLVLTPQLNKAKDSYNFSLAGIPSGMYSCSILLDGNIINKSFVKL